MIYNVATAAELTTALGRAAAGDTIRLAAGNYGTFTMRDRRYAGTVTIEAADPANPAAFDGLTVRNCANVKLVGLDLGRGITPTEFDFMNLNVIRDSENITLSGVRVHGSLDNNPQNDARGLQVVGTRGVLIEDSVFTELNRALLMGGNSNVVVRNNEFKTIRSDGINLASTDGLVISGNKFSDFRPIATDHSDAIQFGNTGQTMGVKNVTIEDNEILITNGEGGEFTGTQGIFISDPLQFGYDNILIRNNVIYSNGAFHGINVDGARQLMILNNTVLSQRTDSKDFWIRIGGSDGVVLDGNIADTFVFANVTRLFQGENTNLRLFPHLANQIPNINSPDQITDLFVPGQGFVTDSVTAQAPVSGALASALSGSISPSQSQQAFKPVPIEEEAPDAGTVGLSLAQIFTAAPVVEATLSMTSEYGGATDFSAPIWSVRDTISPQHFAFA